MTAQKDRIEAAIRHIQTSADIDPWAMELAVEALKAQMNKPMKLSTVCLLCKKPAVTFSTDDDIPYTNYSYCEDCLRKGLKLLKAQPVDKDTNVPNTDCISRQAAIEWCLEGLNNMPSAQHEIIRCRDCKYASPNGVYGCRLERFSVHDESARLFADDYCSAAERRTDE